MAGITDGKFCKKMSSHGFDLVTLGGYNVDKATVAAGRQHKRLFQGAPGFIRNLFGCVKNLGGITPVQGFHKLLVRIAIHILI